MMCSPGTCTAPRPRSLRCGSRLRSSSRSICVTSPTPLRCAFATIAGSLASCSSSHATTSAPLSTSGRLSLSLIARYSRWPDWMQESSMLPSGASKPVCSSALLPLLAPSRMSGAASSMIGSRPAMARRRKMAQPTTPAPMMTALLCAMNSLTRRRFAGDSGPVQGWRRVLDLPQVERLRPGQHLIADPAQGGAAARIFDADPGEGRVEVVTAIHVDGAGLEPVADLFRFVGVRRPQRAGEAVFAVVHEADRLVVGLDLHDADDRAEALFRHHAHGMINVYQHLWCQIRRARLVGGEALGVD